jgi:hypothetical protein
MRRALIGHTGFAGAHPAADGGFTDLFNPAPRERSAQNR